MDETSADLGLTEAERAAWESDGFFTRRTVFAAEEVDRLRRAAESVAARATETEPADRYAIDGNVYRETPMGQEAATVQLEHRAGSQTVRVVEPVHMHDAAFEALVDDPRIVEPMRGLVGSDRVAIFTDKMNLKRPREGSSFAWHQDSPYWTHFCDHVDRLPNVLVALDDAHEGNGCFRVIRGSHTRGCLPGQQGVGILGPLFTHPDAFDLDDQVPAVVPAGSLVFFSPHAVHGSEPNESSEPRRALVLTYQPADLRMFKVDRVRNAGRSSAAPGQPQGQL